MTENCPYKNKCSGVDCDKDFCMRKYRLDCLYDKSLLTDKQRQVGKLFTDEDGTDLHEFQQLAQIEQNIERFVEKGANLYLHSNTCGNGKTSWSIRMLISYFNKIWFKSNFDCQGLFISVPKYLLALKQSIANKDEYADFVNKHIMEADLVIWDDIATKMGTEFELNHLLNIINTRMDNGKSNIFTSNLEEAKLTAALGERLASRICHKSIDIELHGSDKRYLDVIGGEE
jgi:DNA replication protein DnaC